MHVDRFARPSLHPGRPLCIAATLWAASFLGLEATAQCDVEHLEGTWTDIFDQLGFSLAIGPGTLVVGAPGADAFTAPQGREGSVHLFDDTTGTWTELGQLFAPAGDTKDRFGHAVALSGDRLAVGAPDADGISPDDGTAFVFERSSGVWFLAGELLQPDPTGGDRFGSSVAWDGERLLVGAPEHDLLWPEEGAVYAYESGESGWQFAAKLTGLLPTPGARYGYALAADGGWIAIGSPTAASTGYGSGRVDVLLSSGSSYLPQFELPAPVGLGSNALFGFALDVDGSRLAVGAPGANDAVGAGAGSAWIVELATPTPSPEPLVLVDPAPGEDAGTSVLVDGDVAYVGRPDRASFEQEGSGAVDRFVRVALPGPSATWVHESRLDAPSDALTPGFGSALAVSSGALFVGAADEQDLPGGAGFQHGAVYVHDLAKVLVPYAACPGSLSLQTGDTVDVRLRTTVPGAPCVTLVGVSGAAPGFVLDGVTIPVTPDAVTTAGINGALPFDGVLALADGIGEHRARLTLPPGTAPGAAGLTLTFASLVFDPTSFTVASGLGPGQVQLAP